VFTDREIELIAQVARYHRKSAPKKKHAEFAALGKDDQRRVRVLAGILRVAVGLDRNHAGRVAAVTAVTGTDDALVIEATPADDRDIDLELYSANERSELLTEALGRGVEVVERAPEAVGTPA
jgi:exopolyphosphatase/guanosine-5'-triphosphate,3'-diphosphate pyrophosphatase